MANIKILLKKNRFVSIHFRRGRCKSNEISNTLTNNENKVIKKRNENVIEIGKFNYFVQNLASLDAHNFDSEYCKRHPYWTIGLSNFCCVLYPYSNSIFFPLSDILSLTKTYNANPFTNKRTKQTNKIKIAKKKRIIGKIKIIRSSRAAKLKFLIHNT